MKMTWNEFATRYCKTQEQTPDGLAAVLREKIKMFNPQGFFLAEAKLLDSSWLGSVVAIPYGSQNTFKDIPSGPFSPRGIASDTSYAIGYIFASEVPNE